MADFESLTVEILKQIRDEIRSTREELSSRIDQTNQRLDQTNQRLDQTNERLDQTNERLGTVENTLLDLATQQRFLVRNAKRSAQHEAAVQRQLDSHEERLGDLEERTPPKAK